MSDPSADADGSMSDRKRTKYDAIEALVHTAQGHGAGTTSRSNRVNAARNLIRHGWVTQQDLATRTVEEIMRRVDDLLPN